MSAVGGSGGLRSRLVVAFVLVTVATAVITAGTAIVGMIVVPLLLELFEDAAAGQAGYGAHAI